MNKVINTFIVIIAILSFYSCSHEETKNKEESFPEKIKFVCFECTYPRGNKHVVFTEYIQVKKQNGNVSGSGAGYSEGDPEWSFVFSGKMINDTVLKLKAVYTQDGASTLTTSETWIMNLKKGYIFMRERIPENLRSTSNGEYHKIECDYIPENFQALMNKQPKNN